MSFNCVTCGTEFGTKTGVFGVQLSDGTAKCTGCIICPCPHNEDKKNCKLCTPVVSK